MVNIRDSGKMRGAGGIAQVQEVGRGPSLDEVKEMGIGSRKNY